MRARPSPSPWLVAAALLVAWGAAQAVGWTHDPPLTLPGGASGRGLWAEGAFKAHEARRFARFGAFWTLPGDDYRFWLAQSPVHVVPLAGWLTALGPTVGALRAWGVVLHGLALAATAAWFVRSGRPVAAAALGVWAVTDHALRFGARAGLAESTLDAVGVAFVLAGLAALRRPSWLPAVPLLGAAVVLTKQSGVVLLPVGVGVAVAAWSRTAADPAGRRAWWAAVVLALGLAAAGAWYVQTPEVWRTVAWNANHVLGDDDLSTTAPSLGQLAPWAVLGRLVDPARLGDLLWRFPVAGPLAAVAVADTIRRARGGAPVDDDAVAATAALACVLGALQLTDHTFFRYHLLLYPWVGWLAARGAAGLWEAGWRRLVLGAAAVHVAGNLGVTVAHHAQAPSDLWDATAILAPHLTDDAVVTGLPAPWLGFGAPGDHAIVRPPFHCDRDSLTRLGLTHLLQVRRGDWSRDCIEAHAPERLQGAVQRATLRFRGYHYALIELAPASP